VQVIYEIDSNAAGKSKKWKYSLLPSSKVHARTVVLIFIIYDASIINDVARWWAMRARGSCS
jgi:hypothetical protein